MSRSFSAPRLGLALAITVFVGFVAGHPAAAYDGQVIDGASNQPITGATVIMGGTSTTSDSNGKFSVNGQGQALMVRAPGYLARTTTATETDAGPEPIALTPFRPKALYLSYFGVGYGPIRNAALDLVHKGTANAFVIDIKGDRGLVSFPSDNPLVAKIGANKPITIHDLPKLIADLHAEHIYVIGRIVVFKDNPLGTAMPQLAVRDAHGNVYHDREGLVWVDPFHKEVWDYDTSLAVEAAKTGIDEIQFDYVRFPDTKGVQFSKESTEQSRTGAIDGFLAEARQKLAPYNVYRSADVFGYITWNTDDTHIGQKLEDAMPLLDYMSPMLYPSGFQFGIPGYRDPVEHPYEIIKNSLDHARQRINASPLRFRPWLQAFRDYAFDHRVFDGGAIQAQVKAASDFGSDGWMLWNPRNAYTDVVNFQPSSATSSPSPTPSP